MKNKRYETSRLERLSYGGYFLGQNLCYTIQFQFLSYFYTEEVGLSLASTTLLLLIARLWDAFNDPIMGAIVDKCNFKRGKYLFWLRNATYLVPLSLVFVFVSLGQGASYSLKLGFAYVTYILWGMLYTTTDAPLFSMATVMTTQVQERDTLISYGRFAAALAAILSAVFMSLKGAVGWLGAIILYMAVTFGVMLPLQFTCKERVRYRPTEEHVTIGGIFKSLLQNKYLLIYYVGFFAINVVNTLQPMAAYFCNSNLGDEGLLTVVMGLSVLPVLVAAPLLPKLIALLGKKRLTIYASLATIALCMVQYFVGYENFPLFLALTALRVLCCQLPLLIYGMFTADCIEYGAFHTGRRTEGVAFSTQTMVTKLSGTVCQTLCLQLLALYGYQQQTAVQTPRALDGIWKIMTLVPIAGYGVMIVVMLFFYKLTEAQVAEMTAANRQRFATQEDAP